MDPAVAAFNGGRIGPAFERMTNALEALRNIDPASSIQSQYCHVAARHCALSFQTASQTWRDDKPDHKLAVAPGHMSPHQVWMIALRILEQAERSVFRNEMIEALAGWLRAGMTRIIEHETFRLSHPLSTVPPIREVLAQATSARRFVVLLILASDEAVGGNLGEAYREKLRGIAANAKA